MAKRSGSSIHLRGQAAHEFMGGLLAERPKPMDAAMPNDDAYTLGKTALEVGRMHTAEGVGDEIDRGLVLVRLLREKGYAVMKLPKHPS